MFTLEIEGHSYVYKNIGQLNQLLMKRQEALTGEAAYHTERVLKARSEKRAIAKYLGTPIVVAEARLPDEPQVENRSTSHVPAMSRGTN